MMIHLNVTDKWQVLQLFGERRQEEREEGKDSYLQGVIQQYKIRDA